ncbi:MAG: hypothetical protein ACRDUA_25955 [Micromonosporaceae bacterium]
MFPPPSLIDRRSPTAASGQRSRPFGDQSVSRGRAELRRLVGGYQARPGGNRVGSTRVAIPTAGH